MTLSDVIRKVKEELPNSFSDDKLTEFVNEIEADIAEYIGNFSWSKYTYANDSEKKLLVRPPYDKLYISYVKAKIDQTLQEYESYANIIAQFNEDYDEYKSYAIREDKIEYPLPTRIKNVW